MSLADALEEAAAALPAEAEAIRPANGDAARLLAVLSPEGAVRVARWLLAERPGEAEELAEVWCEDARGQVALLGVDEGALGKPGRKLLRRLRHRLRSRGVELPAPPPAPTVARLPQVEAALSGGFVSDFDPLGVRQLWWYESGGPGETLLFECAIDDARGVLSFEVYRPSRGRLRDFLRRLAVHENRVFFAVEPAQAKSLALAAAARQAADRSTPRRWVEWRARLAAAADVPRPGRLVADALGTNDGADALATALRLVGEGRIGPWPPSPAELSPVVERFRNALASPLVVSGATRREQLARLVADAAKELFGDDACRIAAHRLRESAFCFWRRGEEAEARACLSAARAFESEAANEGSVARAFVERWLAPLLGEDEEKKGAGPAPEPSLVVRP